MRLHQNEACKSLTRYWERLRTFILYVTIGIFALAVDLAVYWVIVRTGNIAPVLANIVSMAAGMLASFTLNILLNFKTTDKLLRRFASYTAIVLVGLFISSGMIWYMTTAHSVDPVVAKITMLPVILVVQFTLNKYLTFRPTQHINQSRHYTNVTENT